MTNEEQMMQRYLLGELAEAERAALEREYFDDPRLFDQIVQVETELVDKYARGLLLPPTRERFEKYYLAHPKRRARAEFAQALAAKLEQTAEVTAAPPARAESSWGGWLTSWRGPKLVWAFSLALLLLAAGAAWLVIETRRPQQELAKTESQRTTQEQREREVQAANQRQASEIPPNESDRARAEQETVPALPTRPLKASPAFVFFTLTVGGVRSADTGPPAVLVIPPQTSQVRLQLNLREKDYPNYSAVLQAAGGHEIYTWPRLIPRTIKSGASLALIVPAQRFASGDYILTLRGVGETGAVEDVSKSLFRVERK